LLKFFKIFLIISKLHWGKNMKQTILKTAVSVALGASVMATAPMASAAVNNFDFTGFFTMLDSAGNIVRNTTYGAKAPETMQTPITGTLSFDTVSGAGTGTVVPFSFNNNAAGLEATAKGIKMQAIGDGAGGPGYLVLGNMLFDWNGNVGIPVSIVLDAEGFFTNGASAATPASDGTYAHPNAINADANGYLAMGPVPIATTEWNTSLINGCTYASCMGNGSSGGLPLVIDTAANTSTNIISDGVGVGGSPFQDGPFIDFNPNFDVATLTFTGSVDASIAQNCTFDPNSTCPTVLNAVPVPAAVWLFGSGLLGLVGVARRKKTQV
jgi:hypothetical protein